MGRLGSEQKLLEEDLRRDGISTAAGEIKRPAHTLQHLESSRQLHEKDNQKRLFIRTGDIVPQINQIRIKIDIRFEIAGNNVNKRLRHYETAGESQHQKR